VALGGTMLGVVLTEEPMRIGDVIRHRRRAGSGPPTGFLWGVGSGG
jgi:hypothetical protein